MSVPDAVVESELDFLLNVAGKIVGGHPGGVDVEGGLARLSAGKFIDQSQLATVPGGTVGGTDDPALAGRRDRLQATSKGKVDQLDVVHGDIGAGIASGDPFRELASGNGTRLQQRTEIGR